MGFDEKMRGEEYIDDDFIYELQQDIFLDPDDDVAQARLTEALMLKEIQDEKEKNGGV